MDIPIDRNITHNFNREAMTRSRKVKYKAYGKSNR